MEVRECHKCRYNGKNDPRCIKCLGPAEVSYKGVSFVHPDGAPNPAGIYAQAAYNPARERSTGVTETLTTAQEDMLLRFLADFFAIDDFDMAILKRKFLGRDGQRIATELGTTKQVVHIHLKKLVAARNRMAIAVAVMKRKGIGGARKGVLRSGLVQGELFDDAHARANTGKVITAAARRQDICTQGRKSHGNG